MEHQEFNGITFYQTTPKDYFRHSLGKTTILMHRYVWEYYNCPIPKGYHVHHKDGNRANNDISNLELLKGTVHEKLHGRLLTDEQREWRRNNLNTNARPKAVAWHKSEKGKEWHKEQYQMTRESLHKVDTHTCLNCGIEYEGEPISKFCSNRCKSAYRRKSGIDNVERKCVICGKVFMTNKYRKSVCCSHSCVAKYQHQKRGGINYGNIK